MIVLYLLAAHLVGDYIIQTRWQAVGKFGWTSDASVLRMRHALGYCFPFVPIASLYAGWGNATAFLGGLFVLHFLTDSRRFRSTLGDVAQWQLDRRAAPDIAVRSWIDFLYGDPVDPTALSLEMRLEAARDLDARRLRFPPPNPWPTLPLAIDQTLHVCQIALLAGIFLS